MKRCKHCQTEISKRYNIFCTNRCQKEYEYNDYISRWKSGSESGIGPKGHLSKHVKRYLFEKYQNWCSLCGWSVPHPDSGTPPLEVHHIDGNAYNSGPSNVTLLCPNCHALTSNFRARNKKSARTNRMPLGE